MHYDQELLEMETAHLYALALEQSHDNHGMGEEVQALNALVDRCDPNREHEEFYLKATSFEIAQVAYRKHLRDLYPEAD